MVKNVGQSIPEAWATLCLVNSKYMWYRLLVREKSSAECWATLDKGRLCSGFVTIFSDLDCSRWSWIRYCVS